MRPFLLALVLAALALGQPRVGSRPFRIQELQTPAGFEVSIYAHVNGSPRLMTFGPNGVLYAAGSNSVWAVPAANQSVKILTGLSGAHAVQFKDQDLYVSAADGVYRFANAITDDLIIRTPAEKLIDLPVGGQHTTRTLGFGPDGQIYVTAGSTCNFCVESDPRRAAMLRFQSDGTGQTIIARGLRNSVGFAWHPVTGDLWASDNGGDGLGEDVPPEEINIIQEGHDYGWPDCYGQQQPVNWGRGADTGRCGATTGPEVEMQAHSAPLGISFYTGAQFPASYLNDAFVGFHGSWNRNDPTGHRVVRVHASSGHGGAVDDFLWGFLDRNTRTASGRPVHALNGPDGALYISDDATGNIYRTAYTGPRINPDGVVSRGSRMFELYGANLVNDPAQFSITANGLALQTLYLSKTQINCVVPPGLTGNVVIAVTNEKATDQITISIPE